MKKTSVIMLTLIITALVFSFAPIKSTAQNKLSAQELITKHLESIGSAEARAKTKSRIIIGSNAATFRGRSTGAANGGAVLASTNNNNLLVMRFPSPDYRIEAAGFDGKDFTVSYVQPGSRTTFGNFLLRHDSVFKQGLLGGVLSSAWPLLDMTTTDAKLDYEGAEKIGDRQVHRLRFLPRKGSDLRITLFLDAETFQHLRTQYEQTLAASIGSNIDNSSRQNETRFRMVENFSEFKKEGGLTLPHVYTIQLSVTGNAGTTISEWKMNLTEFNFNRPIDAKSFNVSTY